MDLAPCMQTATLLLSFFFVLRPKMRARTLSALWPLFIQLAGAIPQTHATQHVGTDSFEWFAPEVVNSFDPPALDAKPPVPQPPQKKFAFVVLVHFEPTPWLLSLLRHYRDALPPSWKLVVALSLARLETDGMRFGTKEKPAQDEATNRPATHDEALGQDCK